MSAPTQDLGNGGMPDARTAVPGARSARRITIGSGLNLVARVLSAILGIGVAAVLSRELGPSAYGTFTTALALVTIAAALTDFGTNAVAVKEMTADPARRPVIAGGLIAARSILAVGLLIPLVAAVFVVLPAGTARIAGLIVSATLVLGIIGALQSVVQADLRPEVVGLLVLFQGVSWFGAVALVAYLNGGLVAMAVAFAIASAAQALLTFLVVRRYLRLTLSGWTREGRRLLRIAVPLGAAGMLTTAYYRVDAILVYELAGARDAAFYNAAYRFIDALQIVPNALFTVLFPIVSARRARGQDIQRVFNLALVVLLAAALPLVVAGALLAGPLVRLVFSTSFEPAAPLLAILLLAFLSICLGYLWSGFLLAEGPLRTFTIVAAAAAVLSLSANAILIPTWGATSAAWVTVATEWGVSTAIAVVCVRHYRLRLPILRILRLVGCTICLAGAILATRGMGLLPAALFGALAYAVGIVVFKAVTRGDLALLFSRGHVVAEPQSP